jgi:adenylate cyclase
LARDHRRLAAIVLLDVVGYSRLMGLDDSSTLAALKAHRRELIDPKIAEHDGRIVKGTGDGLLLEFSSVVDAVRCAVDVQRGMAERNEGIAPDKRLEFRIGINVGDIIIDGDDIFGDGVNVAARLEALAEPGGICVSRVVRDQVLDKVSFAFEDLGAHRVKNIARPVDAYRVDLGSDALPAVGNGRRRWRRLVRSRGWRWFGAGGLALGIVAIVLWQLPPSSPSPGPPAMSLAVADFVAPGGSAETAGYAAALRHDVVTGIGALEQRVDLRDAGAETGGGTSNDSPRVGSGKVRYKLNGEIRRANDSGYIANLSLIDATSGAQSWSGVFPLPAPDGSDRSKIVLRKLIRAIADAVDSAEKRRVVALPNKHLDANDLVTRGAAMIGGAYTLDNVRAAKKLYDDALRLEPNNIRALRARAYVVTFEEEVDPNPNHERNVSEFDEFSARALKLNHSDPQSWIYRCGALQYRGQWSAAEEACDQAIRLDPFSSNSYNGKAWLTLHTGRPSEALELTTKAIALEAATPEWAFDTACRAHLILGGAREAIKACERASGLNPDNWSMQLSVQLLLVAAYTNAGEPEKARAAKAAVDRITPGYTIARLRASFPEHPDYLNLAEKYWYAGLRKAGVLEK